MKTAIRNYAFLFWGCVLFHLAGTWNVPLIDRDEPRFAEASREMIERGDYMVPYFNNHFRFDKPPLAYWTQAASYKIFGENDFGARFPSAVAAALVALSIFAWGTRLRTATASQERIGGQSVGWWAAIIFTLSLQTFLHAKAAVADMWLVLFVTLAHWGSYELVGFSEQRRTPNAQRPTPNWNWWWIFYASLGLAFLAKGPIGWVPLLTVSTMFFARDAQIITRFKFLRGILLMLAIVTLWGVPALIQTHGEFFKIGIGRHVIGRSFGAMEGHGANSLGIYLVLLPFYFVAVFASFFPWSIKLPSLAKRLWRGRDQTDNYLLAGAAVIFVIFSLVKTKLPHYTLPAFPLLSLLLARRCVANERFWKRCAIVTSCVYLAIAFVAAPSAAQFFPAAQLYRESRDYLRPEMEFGAVEYTEPSLVWYFRSRVKGWMTTLDADNAAQFMEKGGPRFVVLPTALATKIFPNPPSTCKMFSTRGINIAKGKHVDLTLILKPE